MYLFDSKFPIVQLRYVVSKGDWWCTESFKVLDDIVYIYTTYKRILPIVITFFHIIYWSILVFQKLFHMIFFQN